MEFSEFCKSCEEIASSPKKSRKEFLQNFIEKCRKKMVDDSNFKIFSVLRLMLPQIDRSRVAYGVKEATLAKLFIETLCLPKEGVDAQTLTRYRVPQTTKTVSKDFAEVVYFILRRRCSKTSSTMSVADVNMFLDKFSKAETSKMIEKAHLLRPLLMKMSALEQKWLIRIILRNIKLNGLNEKAILSAYHPDAKELYDVSNDLEKVCTSLEDPFNRPLAIGISIFKPFRPMLADRIEVSKFLTKMGNKPFYVETKLDGERIQIHTDGKKYGFYSRRGFDFSSKYGIDSSSGNFTPRLEDCFHDGVRNCILDGEMVVWNVNGSFIVSKGENTDVKSLPSSGSLVPCFFVFDILLLNDEILTELPYKERLKRLESVVKVKESVIQFPYRKLVHTKAEVTELLNNAIDQREEGIVLKIPDSTYKPNDRKGGWVKVKPEYVNSLMDHLDLIILGGYHGQGRRRDLISMFLMGVAVPSSVEGTPSHEFYSLARVGSGFSDHQLLGLLHKLNPHWKKWDKNAPPSMIHCGKERPDVWIEPSKSTILEIKASEIVPSNSYKTCCTLRFPRVERIREDRDWNSAMTLGELKTLRERDSGKLAARYSSVHEETPSSKRKKVTPVGINVAFPFQAADTSDVIKVSRCFSGKEICILNGTKTVSKHELERKIVSGGGEIVQNPGNSTFCMVAEIDDIRVKGFKNRIKWDIIRPSWVFRCLTFDRLLPYRPEDLMVTTRATMDIMDQSYDRYGNSLTEATTVEDVPSILQRVRELDNPRPLSVSEIADLEIKIFGQIHKYGIFRTCVVYVDAWKEPSDPVFFGELEIISLDLRVYGALVLSSMESSVTHVVCNPTEYPNRVTYWKAENHRRDAKFYLVRPEWVTDSINKGCLIDEAAYVPI